MSERLWEILTDSFTKILVPGLTMTLPLTAIAFFFAMVLAVFMALAQFAGVPVLRQLYQANRRKACSLDIRRSRNLPP